jgi:hypothetical protein
MRREELSGLAPSATYARLGAASPTVTADPAGHATAQVDLADRGELLVTP